ARLCAPGMSRRGEARRNAAVAGAYVRMTGGFQRMYGPMRTALAPGLRTYERGAALTGGGWQRSPHAARISGRSRRASPQAPAELRWMPSELNQSWPCDAAFQSAITTWGHFAA